MFTLVGFKAAQNELCIALCGTLDRVLSKTKLMCVSERASERVTETETE